MAAKTRSPYIASTSTHRYIWSPTGLKFTGLAIVTQLKRLLYRPWSGIHTRIYYGQAMTRFVHKKSECPAMIAPFSSHAFPLQGRVTAYYAHDGLQRYTSFKGQVDQQIRQILPNDRGVVNLSPTSLQMRNRRGLVKWNIRLDNGDPRYQSLIRRKLISRASIIATKILEICIA
jgi:hypothetical protein